MNYYPYNRVHILPLLWFTIKENVVILQHDYFIRKMCILQDATITKNIYLKKEDLYIFSYLFP